MNFKPKKDQIDYAHARWAPVINCVVTYRGKFLLVRRSRRLRFYPDYWNGISGFLDDAKGLREKVEEELREELGLAPRAIKSIRLGEVFDQEAPRYGKTWIVHPILVRVNTKRIKLDWEAQTYRWVTLREAKKLKLLPGFHKVLKNVSRWL